jgi:chromosome segregation ATPase
METLRNKNVQFSTSIVEHQRRMEELNQELWSLRSQVSKLETANHNLNTEKQILKEAEKRLIDQVTQLTQSRAQQQTLLDNLQSLVQAKEKNDTELRQRLSTEIENLQREWYDTPSIDGDSIFTLFCTLVELCESSRVKTEKPPRRLFLSSRCN